MSFLCIATGNMVQCHIPGTASAARFLASAVPGHHRLKRRFADALPIPQLALGPGGLHRGAADHLTNLAGLLCKGAHLRLHILAMQPHHFRQIPGMHQLVRVVERGFRVPLDIGDRLEADVLGTGTHGGAALLERTRCRLRVGEELLKGLACLLNARFGHRPHFLWNFETFTHLFIHGATPCFAQRALRLPATGGLRKPADEIAVMTQGAVPPAWAATGILKLTTHEAPRGSASDGIQRELRLSRLWLPPPWTCHPGRAILTVR